MDFEIEHPRFGHGRIEETMHGGYRLRVSFDDGLTRWVALDEVTTLYKTEDRELGESQTLEPVGEAAPEVATGARDHELTPTPVPMSADSFRARTMVEAFRMGIVPYDCVSDFTFGRDEELADISHWLERQRRGTLVLLGDYGTGKTHLIESILLRGLDAGYAVARAEIDPSERPFHKPKRVYSRVVETLRWRNREGGIQRFEALVRAAAREGAWGEHAYLRYASSQYADGVALWNWLEARESIARPYASEDWFQEQAFPPLFDYANAGNIYSYLLTALGWAAKSVLGLRGLLLVFDEAEAIDWSYTRYQAGKGLNFLRALVRAAANDERLLRVKTSQDLEPTRQGMARDVPFIYKLPTGLKVAFAFTSLDWNEFETWNGQRGRLVPELANAATIQLEPLSHDVLNEVAREIQRVYETAYPSYSVPTLDPALIFSDHDSSVTRLFVKAVIEALDLLRHHPDRPPQLVLR
jgi:hypothetical protein